MNFQEKYNLREVILLVVIMTLFIGFTIVVNYQIKQEEIKSNVQ